MYLQASIVQLWNMIFCAHEHILPPPSQFENPLGLALESSLPRGINYLETEIRTYTAVIQGTVNC